VTWGSEDIYALENDVQRADEERKFGVFKFRVEDK
jgi:hypothetical protein